MMEKAKQDGQAAVALTDHGNMFGAFILVYFLFFDGGASRVLDHKA